MLIMNKEVDFSFEGKEEKIKKIIYAYCDYLYTVRDELYNPYVILRENKKIVLEPIDSWCKTNNSLFFELLENKCSLTIRDRSITFDYQYYNETFEGNFSKILDIILIKNSEIYY